MVLYVDLTTIPIHIFQYYIYANLEGPGCGGLSGVEGGVCNSTIVPALALAAFLASLHFFLWVRFPLSVSSFIPFFFPVSLSLLHLSLSFWRYASLRSGFACRRSLYRRAMSASLRGMSCERQWFHDYKQIYFYKLQNSFYSRYFYKL